MKKIFALLLALSMLFALAACNNSNNQITEPSQSVTEGTENTAEGTEGTTETTQPTITEPPATEPPATEPPATEPPATEPPATEPPATEPPITQPKDYKCSCGFTCTECSVNDGLCAHYTSHYKDHPEACPHYYNGNPSDNWCIHYNPNGEGETHTKECSMCGTTWPSEAHTMEYYAPYFVQGDCDTCGEEWEKCKYCSYYVQIGGGYIHDYGEWIYLTEPCGIFPHYERYCSKCDAYDYRAADGPVTQIPHQGGTATCFAKAICKWCNQPYGDISSNHSNTAILNQKEATCCDGYTGDTYCSDCGKTITGETIPAVRDHSWREVSRVQTDTEYTVTSRCTECGTTSTVSIQIGS